MANLLDGGHIRILETELDLACNGKHCEGMLFFKDNFFSYLYRRIFVYNICLIAISDTVSDGAIKRLILNIERAQHD